MILLRNITGRCLYILLAGTFRCHAKKSVKRFWPLIRDTFIINFNVKFISFLNFQDLWAMANASLNFLTTPVEEQQKLSTKTMRMTWRKLGSRVCSWQILSLSWWNSVSVLCKLCFCLLKNVISLVKKIGKCEKCFWYFRFKFLPFFFFLSTSREIFRSLNIFKRYRTFLSFQFENSRIFYFFYMADNQKFVLM